MIYGCTRRFSVQILPILPLLATFFSAYFYTTGKFLVFFRRFFYNIRYRYNRLGAHAKKGALKVVNLLVRIANMAFQQARGFSRMEVLVVDFCVMLFFSILLPSLTTARDAGKRAVCLANLKTLGTAALLYARDYEDKIPAWGIEFDEIGATQGDPAADWLTKTTDSLAKDFENGYLWEYVQNNAPYTCPSLTNKMTPKRKIGYQVDCEDCIMGSDSRPKYFIFL